MFARDGPAGISAGSRDSLFLPVVRFSPGKTKMSPLCMEEFKKRIKTQGMYDDWARLDLAALGARAVRLLPGETFHSTNGDLRCNVLEVTYDNYYEKIRGIDGPRRYWIDVKTGIVRRIEFARSTSYGVQRFTVVFDNVCLNTTVPQWASNPIREEPLSALVGKKAPDFALLTNSGQQFRLSELRGKVVVLNFWATWCFACVEEIPALEDLRSKFRNSTVLVFGITDEDRGVVNAWEEKYKRHFSTFVGANKTFADFEIHAIPVTVIINGDGIVTNYTRGPVSEGKILQLIGTP